MYGIPQDSETLDDTDPDLQMLPELVELIVLPKLSGLLEFVWDPFSGPQNQRALTLVQRLFADYPTVKVLPPYSSKRALIMHQ